MSTWQLQEAKGKFSEVNKRAVKEGPQNISVHGKPVAVIISRTEYDRLVSPQTDFISFMQASPLAGTGLKITREPSRVRKIRL